MHNETMARNNRRCLAGQQCFFAYFIKNLANINITSDFILRLQIETHAVLVFV